MKPATTSPSRQVSLNVQGVLRWDVEHAGRAVEDWGGGCKPSPTGQLSLMASGPPPKARHGPPTDLEADITFNLYLVLILFLCNTARSLESIFISFMWIMTHLGICLFKWSCPNADSNLGTIKTLRIISSDSKWKTYTCRTNYSALHCLPENFLKTWGLKIVFSEFIYPPPPKSQVSWLLLWCWVVAKSAQGSLAFVTWCGGKYQHFLWGAKEG